MGKEKMLKKWRKVETGEEGRKMKRKGRKERMGSSIRGNDEEEV
jgi:hypothetical protein